VSHSRWVGHQRKLLREVKRLVKLQLGPDATEVAAYSLAYKKEFDGKFSVIERSELFDVCSVADVVMGADFHAFYHSQKTNLRLIEALAKKRKIHLAFECVEARNQEALNDYLAGDASEKVFLERISWKKRWGFDWHQYRSLFEFAKANHISITGINRFSQRRSDSSLAARDEFAAEQIARLREIDPTALIFVLYGELHLAKSHLPLRLKALRPKDRMHVVFQDSEKIYFQLVRQGIEMNLPVVRLSKDRSCIMATPPWIRWQSFLLHLEKGADEGLPFDESDASDISDSFLHVLKLVKEQLSLDLRTEDFHLRSADRNELWEAIATELPKRQVRGAMTLVEESRGFVLPISKTVFLGRPTINHAAQMAGQYLQIKISDRDRQPWDFPKEMIGAIWIEAWGFFTSKLVNPARQPSELQRLRQEAPALIDSGKDSIQIVLTQAVYEVLYLRGAIKKAPRLTAKAKSSFLEASRILGSIFGEKIYLAFRLGKLTISEIHNYMGQDIFDVRFKSVYFELLKEVREE